MRNLLNILFFVLLASFAGIALAQTPDGDPPAVEDPCEAPWINGAAFGLCNAYCEAMDCECRERTDCEPHANDRACDRVRDRFIQLTARDLPCEAFCGNGQVDTPEEECDDGNNEDGDGCSAICELESFCGDGILDTDLGEECDDGNNEDGDGCSAICEIEAGEEPCPCNDINFVSNWVPVTEPGSAGFSAWVQFVGPPVGTVPANQCNTRTDTIELVNFVGSDFPSPGIALDLTAGAEQCSAFSRVGTVDTVRATHPINAGQALGCRTLIEDRAAALGLTCG